MSSSVGMVIPKIWKVIKFMFQSPPTSVWMSVNWPIPWTCKCSKLSSRYLLPGFGLCMPGLWTQTLYILTLHESKPGSLFNIQKGRGTGQIGCEQLPFWEYLASTEAKVEATPSLPKVVPSEVDRQSSIFQGLQCCTNSEVSVLLTNCGSITVTLLSSSVRGQSTLKHRSGMVTHHPNHSSCMVFALTFTSKNMHMIAHECM